MLKNFLNSKTLELSDGGDQKQTEKTEPIRPINAPSHFMLVKIFIILNDHGLAYEAYEAIQIYLDWRKC